MAMTDAQRIQIQKLISQGVTSEMFRREEQYRAFMLSRRTEPVPKKVEGWRWE